MRKASPIPGIEKPHFWNRKWFRAVFFGVPPILAAIAVAARAFTDPHLSPWVAWVTLATIVWLALNLWMKIKDGAKEDARDASDVVHEGLYAAMSTLTAMVTRYCESHGSSSDIRGTFHRVVPPVEDPEKIEQIIPYVGSTSGGLGRESSAGTGITGRAIRCKTPMVMSSTASTEAEHRAELVAEWGYTEAKAKQLTSGRYSAIAVPIFDKDGREPLGVVYLDSSDRAVFGREEVRQIIIVGCEAITMFVTQRYGS